MKNTLTHFAFVGLAFVAAGSLASAFWLQTRLRASEREVAEKTAALERALVVRAAVPTNAPVAQVKKVREASNDLRVTGVAYDGERRLEIRLSRRPEMKDVRQYVLFSPVEPADLSFALGTPTDSRLGPKAAAIVVTGDFPHLTNMTLVVKRGLQTAEGVAREALAVDFWHSFRRKDLEPRCSFAAAGRYLPPCGDRLLSVESVNLPAVDAHVRRVAPENVVQLLSRDEDCYARYYGRADSDDTIELSDVPTTRRHVCRNELNEVESWKIPVACDDQGPSNGVYLVSLEATSRSRHRLVCVSDLGLSVRSDRDGLAVWVVSLLRGVPVPEAEVEIRSSANLKLFEGRTGADGLCRPTRLRDGEPFAVIVRAKDGNDMTFLALSRRHVVDETPDDGARPDYLQPRELTGFLWTERGIYRHGERIFAHLLLRDGERKAPGVQPVCLRLVSPKGRVFAEKTVLSDALGAVSCPDFSVPVDQPSGRWTLRAQLPGKSGPLLAERKVCVEEFAPPQVRVSVETDAAVSPDGFFFTVAAEHLFGGPATALACEGAVLFEDAPFAPSGWKGFVFGNEARALAPAFRRVTGGLLDAAGRFRFSAPLLSETGLPRAMVRATGQATVFEDGGRPASSRVTAALHYYPYYIGSTLSDVERLPTDGHPVLRFACVRPDGTRLAESRRLDVRLERIETVYSCRLEEDGDSVWDVSRVRTPAADVVTVESAVASDTVFALPQLTAGEYFVTVSDPETGVSYGRSFYLGGGEDGDLRAALSNPTEVTLRLDKAIYREGEVPRLSVRAPFAGWALVSVLRDGVRKTQVVELKNATQELVLDPVTAADAPNLEVFVSVVQGVGGNARHLATRAHGRATVCVRPRENELSVSVAAEVRDAREVCAEVKAPGASAVVVTLVDEGINLLTGEEVPDPVGAFATPRTAEHPLHDLYGRILPVDAADLKKGGVKTGGGFGAEMLGRVSPVGTRRFRPLALWKAAEKGADGIWRVVFRLPDFAGEVRLTAVAYSERATGAAALLRKVTPRLILLPDAPRFVAPNDVFGVSLPIHNRSGAPTEVSYEILSEGVRCAAGTGVVLGADASTNIVADVRARAVLGEQTLVYRVSGAGESYERRIDLPVRPAVAWREEAGVCRSEADVPTAVGPFGRVSTRVFDSPLGTYEAALRWLAEYRYGCLEQTCSRVFPLLAAGGILSGIVTNGACAVSAGVGRVASMVRENDFVMWPDCSYAPWDREVSLYAAHLLIVANGAGVSIEPFALQRVRAFLRRWVLEEKTDVAAYAALVLALDEAPDRDRMFRLYDDREGLSALARARLALAFAKLGDLTRTRTLLEGSDDPQSVKEASFRTMALLALDPQEPRVLPLVAWLEARRDRARHCWGTTEANAHALLAIGAYYLANPPRPGERFVAWRRQTLPSTDEVKDESSGIFLSRRFLSADGRPADLARLRCGDLILAELSITSAVTRVVGDLVVEDLFAGAFEPVRRKDTLLPVGTASAATEVEDWVMRTEARDDRMLVFSKSFSLSTGAVARVTYPLRVVSPGDYVLPGPSVEGMYFPSLRSTRAPGKIRVCRQ